MNKTSFRLIYPAKGLVIAMILLPNSVIFYNDTNKQLNSEFQTKVDMHDLIARIAAKAGISEGVAQQGVAIILSFLAKEGPDSQVGKLLDSIPGARAMVEARNDGDSGDSGGGLLGGLLGSAGGMMGAFGELKGLGLEMGEVQTVAKETLEYSKEQAGDETVDEIISSIPGLSQFI